MPGVPKMQPRSFDSARPTATGKVRPSLASLRMTEFFCEAALSQGSPEGDSFIRDIGESVADGAVKFAHTILREIVFEPAQSRPGRFPVRC